MKQCMVFILLARLILAQALAEEAAKAEKAAEEQWEGLRRAQSAHKDVVRADEVLIEAMETEVSEQQAMLREESRALKSPWCSWCFQGC